MAKNAEERDCLGQEANGSGEIRFPMRHKALVYLGVLVAFLQSRRLRRDILRGLDLSITNEFTDESLLGWKNTRWKLFMTKTTIALSYVPLKTLILRVYTGDSITIAPAQHDRQGIPDYECFLEVLRVVVLRQVVERSVCR